VLSRTSFRRYARAWRVAHVRNLTLKIRAMHLDFCVPKCLAHSWWVVHPNRLGAVRSEHHLLGEVALSSRLVKQMAPGGRRIRAFGALRLNFAHLG